MLTKDEILATKGKLKTQVVEVPEWGGDVLASELSGTERDAWEASIVSSQGKTVRRDMRNIRAKLVARCIVDEAGQRLFSDADIDELGALSASALDRVFSVAQQLNGMREADIEELAGN